MTIRSKRIQTMFVQTPQGEVALSGKAGEDPELKPFTESIEDADDGLTNDGQLIINVEKMRAYIQGVFGYKDEDVPFLQSGINAVKNNLSGYENGMPVNCLMTDGSIYSNRGVFAGPIVYNGAGTQELKFVSALDWVIST